MPGSRSGSKQIVPALRELLELTTDDLWLLMENSAGTGGTIGRSTDELAAIHAALDRHPRLGICLDSCHWYASGVDVTDQAVLDAAVADLDRRIGLDRLRCLHVNDSKDGLGSNRDRHDSIGDGLMGKGLHTFLAHPAFQELPAILETPGPDGHGPDAVELERLNERWPERLKARRQAEACHSRLAQSRSCAKTRKLGLATGISENSGLRQPTSSPRCS